MRHRAGERYDKKEAPSIIGETLEKYLSYLGAPPIRTLGALQERWNDIVGPALSEPTRPIELLDGVLVIGCDDATWASQVGWMETQIIRRFHELFPETEVRKITTRIGA